MMTEASKNREDYYESRANCFDEVTRRKGWNKLWNKKLP
jgi:hypothetical protein